MIHEVTLFLEVREGVSVSHHFEQVVDSAEEATEFGMACAFYAQAWNNGFGEAELE
jgi:hypothetical protein